MPAFTLEQLQQMQLDSAKATMADPLAAPFLSLFEANRPLQFDAVEEWMLFHIIARARVQSLVDECLGFGWIVKKPEGYFITPEGSKKAEEV